MPKQGVSFQEVAAAAQKLQAQGERVSARTVRADVGYGSLSTINRHLGAWRSQAQSQTSGADLPPALVSAVARAITQERADAVAELAQQLEDANAASAEMEGLIEAMEVELEAERGRRRQAEDEAVRLGAEAESAVDRARRAEDRALDLSENVDRLRVDLAKAEIAAESERCAANELREQEKALREELGRIRDAGVAAEQRAAVAEAKQQAAERTVQAAERRHRTEAERAEAVLVEERQRVVSLDERLERAREAASTETADLLRDLERARQEISELRVKLAAAPSRANAAKRAKRGPKGDHGRPARLDR